MHYRHGVTMIKLLLALCSTFSVGVCVIAVASWQERWLRAVRLMPALSYSWPQYYTCNPIVIMNLYWVFDQGVGL